jgi:hypothetical protein
VPFEDQRGQGGVGGEVPDRVIPGAASARARDAAVAQSAQSFGIQPAPELLAARGQEIRKMCEVAAYLRVVIEINRTQASRTMNAERAAGRVH